MLEETAELVAPTHGRTSGTRTGTQKNRPSTPRILNNRPYQWPSWRSRIRRALHGDRGAVAAELVIATPLLLLMMLAIVQFALWSHATHIAQAAASQGLAAARVQHGTAAAGTASAQRLLDQLAQGPLTDASVSADRTATAASVRVSGTATSVVPFLTLPVRAEAAGPVERFVPFVYGFTDPDLDIGMDFIITDVGWGEGNTCRTVVRVSPAGESA